MRKHNETSNNDFFEIRAGYEGSGTMLVLDLPCHLYDEFSSSFGTESAERKLMDLYNAYITLNEEQKVLLQKIIYDTNKAIRNIADLCTMMHCMKKFFNKE